MEEENFLILCCGAASVALLEEEEKENKLKRKRPWVRSWVQRRNEEGCCAKLLKELKVENPSLYKNFLRMSSADFDHLVSNRSYFYK